MKISKLYIKIFVSVLLGLVLAEVLMFGVFRRLYRENYHAEIGAIADAHAILIRSYMDTRLAAGDSLQQVTEKLAGIIPGDVWALDERDARLGGSLSEPAPAFGKHSDAHDYDSKYDHDRKFDRVTREGVRFDFEDDRLLALLPVVYPDGRPGKLIFQFRRHKDGPAEKTFALALAGVAVAFALLLFPLSRLLGRPLRELRNSVLRIADGDLNHRARIRSSDEIGELGRAFNQMADRVERMITGTRELTAHVSHELRSPLARIRVAVELLREDKGGGPHSRDAVYDSIHEEIEDLDALIGRILQLSRLDLQAPQSVAPRPTDELIAELSELLARYRPAFDRRGLRCDAELSAARPNSVESLGSNAGVVISPEDFRTIISVLFDNAAKYAKSRVDLKVSIVSPATGVDRSELVLVLGNDCEDCVDTDCERIFEPFQRGSAQTPEGYAASEGLGLAIARKIVQNAGGAISARCVDAAIEFTVRLPASGLVEDS